MLKYIITTLLGLSFSSVYAGDFKEVKNEKDTFEFTGEIIKDDIKSFSDLIAQHKHLTIKVKSNGGSYFTGLALGELTMKNHVHMIAEEAWSAAGYWALADRKHGFENKDSVIGVHLPFYPTDSAYPPETLMIDGVELCDYLEDCGFKHKEAKELISDMTELRIDKGYDACIAWKNNGKYIVTVEKNNFFGVVGIPD